jgi:adenylate kinase family enzyme
LGPGGSGKSRLARRLAQERGLPLHELDTLYWDDESSDYGVRRDAVERDQRLAALVQAEAWILEGVYYKWTGPAFERAEQIIFMDAPLWVRQWRIFKRYFLRKLGLEPKPKEGSLRSTLGLMAWDRDWDGKHRDVLLGALEPYREKVVRG